MRSGLSQSDHDRMVEAIAKVLARAGYKDVKAAVPGFDPPSPIRPDGDGACYIPDVLCRQILVAVETEASINNQNTDAELLALGGFARKVGLQFFVGIPAGCEEKARDRLRELGLEGDVLSL